MKWNCGKNWLSVLCCGTEGVEFKFPVQAHAPPWIHLTATSTWVKKDIVEFSLNGSDFHWIQRIHRNWYNHWSMNESQFNDTPCYLCLCGAMVSSLYLKQGPWVRVQQSFLFLKKKCHWSQRIQWKYLGKTQLWHAGVVIWTDPPF